MWSAGNPSTTNHPVSPSAIVNACAAVRDPVATAGIYHLACPESAKGSFAGSEEAFGNGWMWVMSDIDDHDATLALCRLRRSHARPVIFSIRFHRKLDATAFFIAALFLFLFEDFFDNPGIQHSRTTFRSDVTF